MEWKGQNLPDVQIYKRLGKREYILKYTEFYAEGVCKICCAYDEKPQPSISKFGESVATEAFILYYCTPVRWGLVSERWRNEFEKFLIKEGILNGISK